MRKIIQHINDLLMSITLKRIMKSFKLKGEIKVITKEDIFRELKNSKR